MDTASEVMVVGREAYGVAVVLESETERSVVTPAGDVVHGLMRWWQLRWLSGAQR